MPLAASFALIWHIPVAIGVANMGTLFNIQCFLIYLDPASKLTDAVAGSSGVQ